MILSEVMMLVARSHSIHCC